MISGRIAKWLVFSFVFLFCFSALETNAQQIIKGPYLIEPGENSMVIRWEVDAKSDLKLEFGKDTLKSKLINLNYRDSKHSAFLYEAFITGLKSQSTYYYRLKSDKENVWNAFKTYSDKQEKLKFVAMGDSRSNPEIFARIMQQTSDLNPDFIISMGDLVENGGTYSQWDDYFYSIAKGVIESTPIVSTLGDHEGSGDEGELFQYFLRNDEPVDKQWFSFDYGTAHFISLDYRHPESQEMIDWFINDVQSSDKKWNFVYMHRPSYNLGGHRSSWGKGIWPELFSEYTIDIVFAGHSHLYERFYPTRPRDDEKAFPVTYITTGGAGAGLYEVSPNETVLAVSESVNHFLEFEINGDSLHMQAFRMDGSMLDKFAIVKTKSGYNKEFTDAIIDQEELNTIAMLISSISQSVSSIPLYGFPAVVELNLQAMDKEEIPFEIQLADESATNYVMEAVTDTMRKNEPLEIPLKIYSRSKLTFSPWGELTPELRLRLIYEYNSKRDTIIGGTINYWPNDY